MKARAIVLLCAYFISFVPMSAALAEEVKIGYVDTIKIFSEYKETVEAEEIYRKEVEVWKKKAEEMEKELAALREEIQSQSLMVSEERLSERKLEFDQKAKEYQQYMTDIFSEEGEAARRNKELTQPIVEKINGVIAKLAEEDGYTIIFDSAQGNIVYAKKAIDLTDRIIELLGQQVE